MQCCGHSPDKRLRKADKSLAITPDPALAFRPTQLCNKDVADHLDPPRGLHAPRHRRSGAGIRSAGPVALAVDAECGADARCDDRAARASGIAPVSYS